MFLANLAPRSKTPLAHLRPECHVTDDDDDDDDNDDDLMMIRKRRILMMLVMKGPQCSGDTGVWFWEWMPASWIDLMLPRVLQTS